MKRLFFLFVAIALMSSIVSTATPSAGGGYYEAFIDVNSELKDYMLEAAGVVITAKYDGFYTVQIRDDVSIQTVKAIPGVDHVSKALTLLTCSDSVRYFSRVGNVHSGATLPQAYTGQGVIVGVIDCGFDFNHINLCDENGNTRVKAVYMPLDKTGSQPVVNHRLLPGSCYETPSQIMSLTTDDRNTTHGTQTAGIAAGSYRGNGWYGIAPDADLVLCGMPEGDLTDVRVANCISYINDYASRMGKPCVINISLGSNVGAHDGSSYLCRVFNQYSGPGRVFVVSAGNDGSEPVCVHSSIKSKEDTVVTLLRGYGGGNEYSGYVNAWSNKDKPFNTRFIVANSRTGAILYRSRALGATLSGVYDVFTTDDDPDLAKYCVGSVTVQGVIEFNGRPSSLCELNMRTRSSNYVLGIQYYSPLTTDLVVWTSQYAYFNNYGFSWAAKGTPNGSINDLATCDSIISVGSYNTRQTVPLRDGTIYFRPRSTPVEISYYSSYGPDENGINRPDVCAPGSVVISSANRFDTEAPNLAYWQTPAFVDGEEYPYCPDLGTSMSAPVVTGAIALWMQANPNLSTANVREVLKYSSYKDSPVIHGDRQRWGYGKLDIYAGTRYVLSADELKGDVDHDGEITINDMNIVISIILGGHFDDATMRRADVNHDGEISISDVNTILSLILNN